MFKRVVLFAAFTFCSFAVAHADTISGAFSAGGTDSFTSTSITFTPASSTVEGTISGTFLSYLADGNPITFVSGSVPYLIGTHTDSLADLFTITEKGETFDFNLTSYDAAYVSNGTDGCASGNTCLVITGTGNYTGSGAATYAASPGTFIFTSQYTPGQKSPDVTTFSASTSVAPEPASLALLGTGLLGIVGIARRKFAA